MDNKLKIVALIGSLREKSLNKYLLNYVKNKAEDTLDIETADINLPLFNEDIETNPQESVIKLRNIIKNSDGILFVTPEYNYSITGVLKNAIDWGSRPYTDNVFFKKPVGIIGVSSGAMGTSRAQYHLRQTCVFLNAFVMPKPEVIITFAKEKFSDDGTLIDVDTQNVTNSFIESFTKWVEGINKIKDSL